MYAGPAICGIPVEASRGFLHGWYAQNGVSLGNPRLGYVCVSEDVTGQFGLCGYFKEYDHDLAPEERLVFAPDERPPAFNPEQQPVPPAQDWSAERLAKANRNYAMEYVRNGLGALIDLIGRDAALAHAKQAARLTGLQNFPALARAVGAVDGGPADSAAFLTAIMSGMGDDCVSVVTENEAHQIVQTGLRIVRGLSGSARQDLLECWTELWRGALDSQRAFVDVQCEIGEIELTWTMQA